MDIAGLKVTRFYLTGRLKVGHHDKTHLFIEKVVCF